MTRAWWVLVVLAGVAAWLALRPAPAVPVPGAAPLAAHPVRTALAAAAVPVPEPAAAPAPVEERPEGFCGGPASPEGYSRPSSGQAVLDILRDDLTQDGGSARAGAAQAALKALRAEPEQAWPEVERALARAPDHPPVLAVAAWTALRTGRPWTAVEYGQRVVAAYPGLPALQRELAEAAAQTHQVDLAARAMELYAAQEPRDWSAVRRLRLFQVQRDLEAEFLRTPDALFPVERDPQVPASTARAVLDALHQALPAVQRFFPGLVNPVAVVIYAERADLLAVTCAQGWSNAVFDGRLRLQAEDGGVLHHPESLQRVTAHELTHVLQRRAQARGDVWLVEGLARYVAKEEDRGYRNRIALLARTGAYIPLGSMVGSFQALESSDDSSLAYDQALMMVHWVVARRGEDGVRQLLEVQGGESAALSALASVVGEPVERLGPAFLDWVVQASRASP